MGIKINFINKIINFNLFRKTMLGGMIANQRLGKLKEKPDSVQTNMKENQESKTTFSDNEIEYDITFEEQKKIH